MSSPSSTRKRTSHAKRRAYERHGLEIKPREIVRLIQSNKAFFVRRESNRVTRWRVEYEGQKLDVIYDSKHHCLVTVLSPPKHHEAIQNDRPPSNREELERAAKLERDKRDKERAFGG